MLISTVCARVCVCGGGSSPDSFNTLQHYPCGPGIQLMMPSVISQISGPELEMSVIIAAAAVRYLHSRLDAIVCRPTLANSNGSPRREGEMHAMIQGVWAATLQVSIIFTMSKLTFVCFPFFTLSITGKL